MAISGAIAAVAAVVGAIGMVQAGNAQKKSADMQATVMGQQADYERQKAARDEEDYRRDASALAAQQRALLGAAGVDTSTGTPLLLQENLAGEAEYQALKIRSGGELAATRMEQQSTIVRYEGKQAQRAAYFGAGATLLGGASKAASMGAKA